MDKMQAWFNSNSGSTNCMNEKVHLPITQILHAFVADLISVHVVGQQHHMLNSLPQFRVLFHSGFLKKKNYFYHFF